MIPFHQTYYWYVYSLVVRGHGDPVLGPLAGEVDAHARHDGRRVAQAHRRQVQAASRELFEFCRHIRLSDPPGGLRDHFTLIALGVCLGWGWASSHAKFCNRLT